MQDNRAIHPLAQPKVKSGRITYICFQDGKEHTFSTAVNRLTGDRMSWFDNDMPDVGQPISSVKVVFKNIREKATRIVSCIGDF